ncbi:selenocysteine-specific translation elongation factor [Pimelobacter simplex]|uniref:selenocysteine-specific translation elongation factor n=1 Tax=Nocardioides simplex TaxID=2045 RepID=UPI001EC73198|nr:selenocysteine-specific translation elongation factor [Pimelobacter simplex]
MLGATLRSYVVATAGHVDHGKSTLIRCLTGTEPDRWEEERRRGLSIDLGYAGMKLPGGEHVGFVDVPGHRRFVGNMLAGLGPAPVVLLVVAADSGWQAQTSEHRDAIAALGICRGVVAVTRIDCASAEQIQRTRAQVVRELAGTPLADAPVVEVSSISGAGADDLVATLASVLTTSSEPSSGRLRFWVDRSFSVSGSGTVVTGTLTAGALGIGDELDVLRGPDVLRVTVRRLECDGESLATAAPVSRVALNLRGVGVADVRRGSVLMTPGRWRQTELVDARCTWGSGEPIPTEVHLHVGTSASVARVRALGEQHVRLRLRRPQPLAPGDRVILRNPGDGSIQGAVIIDTDPPALNRRGDAARRAAELQASPLTGDVAFEVRRRRSVPLNQLLLLGLAEEANSEPPAGVIAHAGWWIDAAACASWASTLSEAVANHHARDPLSPGIAHAAASQLAGIPHGDILPLVLRRAGLESSGGFVHGPGRGHDLGPAETAIARVEARLSRNAFDAPLVRDLDALGLGQRELAAAARSGRILRLASNVVLLPSAPVLALREFVRLPQPFTTSQARLALGSSRRVAIALSEHMDGRGWTRRDGDARRVVLQDPDWKDLSKG